MQNYGGNYSQYPQNNQAFRMQGTPNNMNPNSNYNSQMYGMPMNPLQTPMQPYGFQHPQQQNYTFHFDYGNAPGNMNMAPYGQAIPQYGNQPYNMMADQQNSQPKSDKNSEYFNNLDPFSSNPKSKPQTIQQPKVEPSKPQIQIIDNVQPKKPDLAALRSEFGSFSNNTPQQYNQPSSQYGFGISNYGNQQNSVPPQVNGFTFTNNQGSNPTSPPMPGFNFTNGATSNTSQPSFPANPNNNNQNEFFSFTQRSTNQNQSNFQQQTKPAGNVRDLFSSQEPEQIISPVVQSPQQSSNPTQLQSTPFIQQQNSFIPTQQQNSFAHTQNVQQQPVQNRNDDIFSQFNPLAGSTPSKAPASEPLDSFLDFQQPNISTNQSKETANSTPFTMPTTEQQGSSNQQTTFPQQTGSNPTTPNLFSQQTGSNPFASASNEVNDIFSSAPAMPIPSNNNKNTNPFITNQPDSINPFINQQVNASIPNEPQPIPQETHRQPEQQGSGGASVFGQAFREAIGDSQPAPQKEEEENASNNSDIDFKNIFNKGQNFFQNQQQANQADGFSFTQSFGDNATTNQSSFTGFNDNAQESSFGGLTTNANPFTNDKQQQGQFGDTTNPFTNNISNNQTTTFGGSSFNGFGDNQQQQGFGISAKQNENQQPIESCEQNSSFTPFGVNNFQPTNSTFIIDENTMNNQPMGVGVAPFQPPTNIPYFVEEEKKREIEQARKNDSMYVFDPFNANCNLSELEKKDKEEIERIRKLKEQKKEKEERERKERERKATVKASVADIRNLFGSLSEDENKPAETKQQDEPSKQSNQEVENPFASNSEAPNLFSNNNEPANPFAPKAETTTIPFANDQKGPNLFAADSDSTFTLESQKSDNKSDSQIQLNVGFGEVPDTSHLFASEPNATITSFGSSPQSNPFGDASGFSHYDQFGGMFGQKDPSTFHNVFASSDSSNPGNFNDFFPNQIDPKSREPVNVQEVSERKDKEIFAFSPYKPDSPQIEAEQNGIKEEPKVSDTDDLFGSGSPFESFGQQSSSASPEQTSKLSTDDLFDFTTPTQELSIEEKEKDTTPSINEEKPTQPKKEPFNPFASSNPQFNPFADGSFGQKFEKTTTPPPETQPIQAKETSNKPLHSFGSSETKPRIPKTPLTLPTRPPERPPPRVLPSKQPPPSHSEPEKRPAASKSKGKDIFDDIPDDASQIDTSLPEKPPPFEMPIADTSSNPFAASFGGGGNPFTQSSSVNPFTSSAPSNPFASATPSQPSYPFATNNPTPPSNPFATNLSSDKLDSTSNLNENEQRSESANPFSAGKSNSIPVLENAKAVDNPFASSSNQTSNVVTDDDATTSQEIPQNTLFDFQFGQTSSSPAQTQVAIDDFFAETQTEEIPASKQEEQKKEDDKKVDDTGEVSGFTFSSTTGDSDSKTFSNGFNPFGGNFSNPFASPSSNNESSFSPFGNSSQETQQQKPNAKETQEIEQPKENPKVQAKTDDDLNLLDFTAETQTIIPTSAQAENDLFPLQKTFSTSLSTSNFLEMKQKKDTNAGSNAALSSDGGASSKKPKHQSPNSMLTINYATAGFNQMSTMSQEQPFTESSNDEEFGIPAMTEQTAMSKILKKFIKPSENDFYGQFEKDAHPIMPFPKFDQTQAAQILADFVKKEFGITPTFVTATQKQPSEIDMSSIFNMPAAAEPTDNDDFLFMV